MNRWVPFGLLAIACGALLPAQTKPIILTVVVVTMFDRGPVLSAAVIRRTSNSVRRFGQST